MGGADRVLSELRAAIKSSDAARAFDRLRGYVSDEAVADPAMRAVAKEIL